MEIKLTLGIDSPNYSRHAMLHCTFLRYHFLSNSPDSQFLCYVSQQTMHHLQSDPGCNYTASMFVRPF